MHATQKDRFTPENVFVAVRWRHFMAFLYVALLRIDIISFEAKIKFICSMRYIKLPYEWIVIREIEFDRKRISRIESMRKLCAGDAHT